MTSKAYNPAWARHEAIRTAARRWHKAGLLSAAQWEAVQAAYPLTYYRPSLFVRLVLFFFTALGYLAGAGMVGMFFAGAGVEAFIVFYVISAALGFFTLEQIIRSSQLYHSGPDNALLYIGLGWVGAILAHIMGYDFWLLSGLLPVLLLPLLAVLVAAVVRYADRLVTAAAYVVVLLLVSNLLLISSGAGQLLLPFAIMLVSAGTYQLSRVLGRRTDYLYYKDCLDMLKMLALATLYLGGNYLVVREGNAALTDQLYSAPIPFGFLFYGFTIVIPAIYLLVGLRYQRRLWLLMGLATLTFSGYTIRYYHSVLPPEVAATLLGAVLLALAAGAMRYLRTPRHGLTAEADGEQHFNLESLIVSQTTHAHLQPQPEQFDFGGGHSGGGGANGAY